MMTDQDTKLKVDEDIEIFRHNIDKEVFGRCDCKSDGASSYPRFSWLSVSRRVEQEYTARVKGRYCWFYAQTQDKELKSMQPQVSCESLHLLLCLGERCLLELQPECIPLLLQEHVCKLLPVPGPDRLPGVATGTQCTAGCRVCGHGHPHCGLNC